MSQVEAKPKEEIKIRHHPFVVPVITFLVLFFFTVAAFINFGGQTLEPSDSRIVSLNIAGNEQIIPTRAKTVEDLLKKFGIELYERDKVEPSLDTPILEDNFVVNIYRARPVTIIDGDKKITTLSPEPTPRAVAKEAGVALYPEDKVMTTQPEDILRDGTLGDKVVVDRAMPLKLNLYGVTYDIRTHAKTVHELVKEQGIEPVQTSVFPSLDTALEPNTAVFVTQPGKRITVTEEAIPQGEESVPDYNLPLGQTQVRDPGQPGRKAVVYEVAADDNKKSLYEVIIAQPVNKVVVRGRKIERIFSGSFEAALAALRGCESGGNYSINTGNGYYGAYQYNISTWANYGGYSLPSQAPPIIQDQKAWETYSRRGWQPWPACSQKLGLQDAYR